MINLSASKFAKQDFYCVILGLGAIMDISMSVSEISVQRCFYCLSRLFLLNGLRTCVFISNYRHPRLEYLLTKIFSHTFQKIGWIMVLRFQFIFGVNYFSFKLSWLSVPNFHSAKEGGLF